MWRSSHCHSSTKSQSPLFSVFSSSCFIWDSFIKKKKLCSLSFFLHQFMYFLQSYSMDIMNQGFFFSFCFHFGNLCVSDVQSIASYIQKSYTVYPNDNKTQENSLTDKKKVRRQHQFEIFIKESRRTWIFKLVHSIFSTSLARVNLIENPFVFFLSLCCYFFFLFLLPSSKNCVSLFNVNVLLVFIFPCDSLCMFNRFSWSTSHWMAEYFFSSFYVSVLRMVRENVIPLLKPLYGSVNNPIDQTWKH